MLSDHDGRGPLFITVKKDQTVKLAMDWKQISKAIRMNGNQMPNVNLFLRNVAQSAQESHDKPGSSIFLTIDLRYAYSQLNLDDTTKTQCNFSIIGGQATGT